MISRLAVSVVCRLGTVRLSLGGEEEVGRLEEDLDFISTVEDILTAIEAGMIPVPRVVKVLTTVSTAFRECEALGNLVEHFASRNGNGKAKVRRSYKRKPKVAPAPALPASALSTQNDTETDWSAERAASYARLNALPSKAEARAIQTADAQTATPEEAPRPRTRKPRADRGKPRGPRKGAATPVGKNEENTQQAEEWEAGPPATEGLPED